MKYGFVKVAAITPEVRVANVEYNCDTICSFMETAAKENVKVTVFPELCITGYTCQDLFLQDELLEAAKSALRIITEKSSSLDGIFFIGLPLAHQGKLYNVCTTIHRGRILGVVPKIHLPNYNEFYEVRHFASGKNIHTMINLNGQEVPFSSKLVFTCDNMPSLRISAEICEDLWVPNSPSIDHCLAGATMIVNLSASDEITGKSQYRRDLVTGQSARLVCAYIYASAGASESTQDVVYSGHNIIAENGNLLVQSPVFSHGMTTTECDMKRIEAERRRMTTFSDSYDKEYTQVGFSLELTQTKITRHIDPHPFVPSDLAKRAHRCEEIVNIQAMGLKKRLHHIGCKTAVIGISGGLDSTLALLVTVRAFDLLELDHKGIIAVTMPGFGTTERTYQNALHLIDCLNASLRQISIVNAVNVHFEDIKHDSAVHDVTYENSQARERTQILMDLANQMGGIVIGTGDLSELALGWATYNGDHMSMYAVNASVPKTLVRYLVQYFADSGDNNLLSDTLYDILDTPVSPELLPPENGEISQKTEDLVGPYELHDFFLYHMLRQGSSPDKICALAKIAFEGKYTEDYILKWEKNYYKRFFAQHFKRSCLPDSPKVGTVSVSPRGDLRMPTDAEVSLWTKNL